MGVHFGGEDLSSDTTDAVLMQHIAAGDAIAFESLMRRHMRRAVAVAQGVVGNATDADEIAQEAFMRVWRHAGRWDARIARFTTWLYRIVINLSLDRRRRPQWLPLEDAGDLFDMSDSAPQRIIRRQRREQVVQAMERISPRQRAAVTLFYFEELSGREGAEAMGISIAAFEQLLARARRALKSRIKRRYSGGGERIMKHALSDEQLDIWLTEAMPWISEGRISRLIEETMYRCTSLETGDSAVDDDGLPPWRDLILAPRNAIFAGLFLLGCLANLWIRAPLSEAPLDMLFNSFLFVPLGG